MQVGARLSQATIPVARLVCTAWAAGIALGVTRLRPRLTGASGMQLSYCTCRSRGRLCMWSLRGHSVIKPQDNKCQTFTPAAGGA